MSIQRMNNQELEVNLKKLVFQERELLHEILLHIQQVEVRRIYLDRAYSSIYEYLVKELNYSGSAAMRRIEAARLLKQIPSLSAQIETGDLNLSQIGELSKAFKEKEKQSGVKVGLSQKEELLAKISGKSVAETQKEISKALDLDLAEPEKARVQKDDSVVLSITLTKEQYAKLNRCRDKSIDKLSQQNKGYSWAEVIENLMDQFLDKETVARAESKVADSAQDIVNTSKRKNKNSNSNIEIVKAPINTTHKRAITTAAVLSRVNKTLTPKTKRTVLKRDGCCQYVDKNSGRRCESTFGLEVDHRIPRFAGGGHEPNNLQALCRKHNLHKYHQQAQIRFL